MPLTGRDGGHPQTPGGATLTLHPPAGAAREPDEALPPVAVPALPGARIAARIGYRSGAVTLRAACLAAPANGWAPGIEEIVLGRATQLARESLGGEVTPFTVGDRAAVGPRFEQRFEGVLRRDPALAVRGRHWLGFGGDAPDAIVCTAVCTEPEHAAPPACEALIEGAAPTGTWAEAPPPNLLARSLLLAAEQPQAAAAVLMTASLAVAALILARRPRPRAYP